MNVTQNKIAIVSNPVSSKAINITKEISLLLNGMNISHKEFTSRWPENFEEFNQVWISGGDGTMNYFINRYPQIKLPLTLFKGGTGNDFHWMIYGDISMQQQVDLVLDGKPELVDAGVCNGRIFLNGVGLGFDGSVVRSLLGRRKRLGKMSYYISIVKHIIGYAEMTYSIDMGDQVMEKECFMINVANGRRYGGGFIVAPGALCTDGLLDINIVGRISRLKRLKYLPAIEKGKHLQLPFIDYMQKSRIGISSPLSVPSHMDGEYFESGHFEMECLPAAYSFIR